MAKPELGTKHQCQNCGTKFFDLNKDPIVCPKCGTTFQVATAAAAPSRASRAARRQDEEDEPETEEGAEVVSLEDADQTEDGKVEAASTDDDDVDADDDDSSNNSDDDDTFLEDEEDDGDVSGLIDGDIEDDEER